MTTRLIERYLPIAEIGIESVRERTPMTPFPAPNRLHVWWARRPLVASRAAVLASILPEDADRDAFKHALGIHGDPVASRRRIDIARQKGERFEGKAYSYPRAFTHNPSLEDLAEKLGLTAPLTVLDPTAGGGAIPLEAMRLGLVSIANDLNPVATFVQHATIDYPRQFGRELVREYKDLSRRFVDARTPRIASYYSPEPDDFTKSTNFLWARTIICPHCEGMVPLSPNWQLNGAGVGLALRPYLGSGPGDNARRCSFEVVTSNKAHSPGTVSSGDGLCPFPDCGRPIDGDDIKAQAQAGNMGDQLIAVVHKRETVVGVLKSGKNKIRWVRGYRAPAPGDVDEAALLAAVMDRQAEWESEDTVPQEAIPVGNKTEEPHRYGMMFWRDIFSPRQLLVHAVGVEIFRELLRDDEQRGLLTPVRRAAYLYLAIALDKNRDYNSRMTRWHSKREAMVNTFDRHDFAFKWSYAEMSMFDDGTGGDWATDATAKALEELVAMTNGPDDPGLFSVGPNAGGSIAILNGSGASMPSIADNSVDAVVMDPPYGANVMYAELSDFFYVWLKRTAGLVIPELFTRRLADKESEAVANKAHFQGQKGAAKLANRDYQDKMAGIFAESRRVLKDDGIMTVMFTHKETGAWDALAMSLMHAGFVITASWPVNTEASGSLHIKDKAAANSTIFLVCRPRLEEGEATNYWEDVEPLVAKAVRDRIDEFQECGIAGVDLYLASFGPALEAFSRHWPLTRGTPAPQPPAKRGSQGDLLGEFDPYAVRPEDALNAARREVKAWRLAQLADRRASRDMDPATAWVALAWDAFRAPQFAYDEGLRLARAVGLDMAQVVGRIAEKKGSDLKLWDSATRVARGALGPADGSRGMIDALHHVAHTARNQSVEAAREMLETNGLIEDDEFKVALEVMLEVLPPSKTFSGIDADEAVKPAADDFDALEKLRRIIYGDEIGEPHQLSLYEKFDAA